jgi:hypothetical protein
MSEAFSSVALSIISGSNPAPSAIPSDRLQKPMIAGFEAVPCLPRVAWIWMSSFVAGNVLVSAVQDTALDACARHS